MAQNRWSETPRKMTSTVSNVLVVEDDPAMLRFIRRTLEVAGHIVVTATDGLAALDQFHRHLPSLVVLDIGIPHIDGFEVCRQMQAFHPVPIIMVTARGEDLDVVRGFEVGAHDYLAKPFAGRVLSARVNSLLRRSQRWLEPGDGRFECGDIILDQGAHRVMRDGHALHLTPTEYKLFQLLARYQGKVLTTGQIFTEVWGSESDGDPQMLRTQIARLRKKIDKGPSTPSLISTERGVGYCLNCPDPS